MTETAAGRRRLGRGLEALLGPTREEAEREGSLVELPIKDVRPNPFQPRKTVDPTALEELVSSIRQAGLPQPKILFRTHCGTGAVVMIFCGRPLRASPHVLTVRIPSHYSAPNVAYPGT